MGRVQLYQRTILLVLLKYRFGVDGEIRVLINDETSLVDLCMTGILGVREVLMDRTRCSATGWARFASTLGYSGGGPIQLFS